MVKLLILTLAILNFAAPMALAGSGKTIACYKQVQIAPKYRVKNILVKKKYRKYVYYSDHVRLVEVPALYREKKTLIKDGYTVLRETRCK
jgi:hypothetical protein